MSRTRQRTLTWGPPLLLALAATAALGGPGLVLALLASGLWIAWRLDNASGTFFVLAALLVIAVAVPAMLLALMAVTH